MLNIRHPSIVCVLFTCGCTLCQATAPNAYADVPANEREVLEAQERSLLSPVKENPGDVIARLQLGKFYIDNNRPRMAVPPLREAVSVKTNYPTALLLLGIALQKGDNTEQEESVEVLHRAVELEAENYLAWINLGQSRLLLGQHEQAREAFETTLALDPPSDITASAYLALAGIYEHDGAVEKAQQYYQKAYTVAPELTEYVSNAQVQQVTLNKALLILKDERCSEEWVTWAAQVAGQMKDTRAVEPLLSYIPTINNISHSHREVRVAVAWALGQIGDPRVIGPMIEALASDSHETYKGVSGVGPFAHSLAQFGEQAVGPLIEALSGENNRIYEGAILALGLIKNPRAVEAVSRFLFKDGVVDNELEVTEIKPAVYRGLHQPASWALAEIQDPRGINALIAALGCSDSYGMAYARQQVARMGEPAVEPLIQTLKHEDGRIRAGATVALGAIRDPRALEPLICRLEDDDSFVRHDVVHPIAQLIVFGPESTRNDPRAIKALIAALKDESLFVRNLAVQVLAHTREPIIFEALVGALKDPHWGVRGHAAQGLGWLQDRRAVEPLIAALSDDIPFVAEHAGAALAEIRDVQAVEPLAAALNGDRPFLPSSAAKALANIGLPGLDPLLTALKSERGGIRLAASSAAEEITDVQAVKPLLAILTKHNDDARNRSRHARRSRHGRRVSHQERIAQQEQQRIVAWAAEALGAIGDPRAVEPLATLTADNSAILSGAAREALIDIGEPAVGSLIMILKTDAQRREGAALALGGIGDARAVEPLIAALTKSPTHSYGVARALAEIGKPAVLPLIDLLRDANADVRSKAAYLLGRIKDPRAVEPLISTLRRENTTLVQMCAVEALGAISDSRVIEPLLRALTSKTTYPAATVALMRMQDVDDATPLTKALSDGNPLVRERAAKVLCQVRSPLSIKALIAALKDKEESVRDATADALLKGARNDEINIHHPLVVDHFISALNDEDAFTRKICADGVAVLAKDDPWARDRLMVAIRDNELDVVARAYRFYVEKGEAGSEDTLISALNEYGSGNMAVEFIRCGNTQLEQAGKRWLTKHDITVNTVHGLRAFPLRWKSKKGNVSSSQPIIRNVRPGRQSQLNESSNLPNEHKARQEALEKRLERHRAEREERRKKARESRLRRNAD